MRTRFVLVFIFGFILFLFDDSYKPTIHEFAVFMLDKFWKFPYYMIFNNEDVTFLNNLRITKYNK